MTTSVTFGELDPCRVLVARGKVGCLEINKICWTLSREIVKYRRVYEGGKSRLEMNFNKDLFLEMRDRLEQFYDESKEMFQTIQEGGFKGKEQMEVYEAYN
jgi:hypothetical protein